VACRLRKLSGSGHEDPRVRTKARGHDTGCTSRAIFLAKLSSVVFVKPQNRCLGTSQGHSLDLRFMFCMLIAGVTSGAVRFVVVLAARQGSVRPPRSKPETFSQTLHDDGSD
jgi:hypothetical protein